MEPYLVLGVIGTCLLALIFTHFAADVVLLMGVLVLVSCGVLGAGEAIKGFANEGLVTVGLLYIVAQGVRDTGGIHALVRTLLNSEGGLWKTQLRMMSVVGAMSAFLNNTPVVATFLPAIREWASSRGVPPSKLLIPLSYSAILGGTCTIIGTSTNVVVNNMLIDHDIEGLKFFDLAWVGVPCVLVGIVYIIVVGRWLLPARGGTTEAFKNTKEYTVEMVIQQGCELINRSVAEAGLRSLAGLYLVEVYRGKSVIAPVTPELELLVGDRLVFTGIPESIADLRKYRGLVPADNPIFGLGGAHGERCFIEAVVSRENPLAGTTIRDGHFRNHYDAAVLAVSRYGERISKKVGDIVLKPSDTLLLEGHSSFVEIHRHSRDFLLLNLVKDSMAPKFDKAWIAWACVLAMVVLAASGLVTILHAAMLATAAMILTGCCHLDKVSKAIDYRVLLVLASALSFSYAIEKTGIGLQIANTFFAMPQMTPLMLLVLVYALTVLLTELITNMAAAVLVFSIISQFVESMGLNLVPFAVAIMVAASASFISPIGYQTNLMVYGPGGYRFMDFVRFGAPLSIIVAATALIIIPIVWPLHIAGS